MDSLTNEKFLHQRCESRLRICQAQIEKLNICVMEFAQILWGNDYLSHTEQETLETVEAILRKHKGEG